MYECPDCGKQYRSIAWLIKHCAKKHCLLVERVEKKKEKDVMAVIGHYKPLSTFAGPIKNH